MSDDDPSSTLGDTVMETDALSNTNDLSISMLLNENKEGSSKKRRNTRKKSDGYKSRKRTKSNKPATKAADEYEVEMIIDHKTDDEVK